jgi:1-acyl-sn-glycerol-3-phosphate acyltransferase
MKEKTRISPREKLWPFEPGISVVIRAKWEGWCGDFWYNTSYVLLRFAHLFRPVVCISSLDLEGLRTEFKGRGVIVVANHISHYDPYLIGFSCKRLVPIIHYFAKKELVDFRQQQQHYQASFNYQPLWLATSAAWLVARVATFVVSRSGIFPIDRERDGARMNRDAVVAAKAVLQKGGAIGIFPQGGINRVGSRRIATSLAKKTNSVVLPVYIHKKPQPWDKTHPWLITVGRPIDSNTLDTIDQSDDPGQALLDHIMSIK